MTPKMHLTPPPYCGMIVEDLRVTCHARSIDALLTLARAMGQHISLSKSVKGSEEGKEWESTYQRLSLRPSR